MRIIGIDASTNKTGIAVLDDGKYVTSALIDLHKMTDAKARIPKMMMEICAYLDEHKADKIVMEESWYVSNISTVKMLAELAGAVRYYAASHGIEIEFMLPTAWRRRVGLVQSAKVKREKLKEEALEAVKYEFGLDIPEDEAEATLIAKAGFSVVVEEDVNEWVI